MAFISLFFASIFLMILFAVILVLALIGFVLLIISLVLFVKKQNNNNRKGKSKRAIALLIAGLFLLLPLLFSVLFATFSPLAAEVKREKEVEQELASMEEIVYVEKEEWKKGFQFKKKDLVPLHSDEIQISIKSAEKTLAGAIMIKDRSSYYYKVYEIDVENGNKIYYITSPDGNDSFGAFVDIKEYEKLFKDYGKVHMNVAAQWFSAPEETNLSYQMLKIDLNLDPYVPQLIELSHATINTVSKNSQLPKVYDDGVKIELKSDDGIYKISISIYDMGDNMKVYFYGYEVDEHLIAENKELFQTLMEKSEEKLLRKAEE